ncbi:bacterial Ig-like domain-containing protein [Enterococcus sp. AZ192]|uniref:bacterial Ig-like domain-containing protein n=1 Tax=unclassified Enterococcus TaxID=2608891 RepID=UPI003D281D20
MKKRMLSIFSLVVLVASYASGIVSVYAESIETIKEPRVYGSDEEQVQNEEVPTETSSQSAEEPIDQVESSDDAYDLGRNELNSSISEERNVETQNTTELKELSDDVYSGTFGTSDWRIDSNGILHIGAGNFESTIGESPWTTYSDQINRIVFEGKVLAHSNSNNLFSKFPNLESIENLELLDTSQATLMNNMFSMCPKLRSLDVSTFNTSSVTDMGGMFAYNPGLVSLNVSGLDLSRTWFLNLMFAECSSLKELDVSSFRTPVNGMGSMFAMFRDCSSLEYLDLSGFDMMKINSNINREFLAGTTSLTKLKLGSKVRFTNVEALPDVPTNTQYTEKWQNIGDGTPERPNGSYVFTSKELTAFNNYQGSEMADTYVWQPTQVEQTGDIIISYVDTFGNNISDPVTGFEIQPVTFSGKIGDVADDDLYYVDAIGWVLLTELPTGIVYGKNPQNYKMVYDKAGTIYVNYEDTLGNKLKAEERNTEYISKFDWSSGGLPESVAYEIETIEMDGYNFIGTEGDPKAGNIEAYEIKRITFKYEKIDYPSLNVHDSTIQVGESWNAADNFDSATDKAGNSVDFEDVTVKGCVDTTKEGEYEVSYSYEETTSIAKITVKAKEAAPIINVQDSSIQVGDSWKAADNFINAFDKNGKLLDFSEIKVTGEVDTTKEGEYEVSYSYEETTSVAKIAVKAKEVAPIINVHDSSIQLGDNWKASDNFISAFDRLGNAVEFKTIRIEGTVDTKKVGTYEVKYSYDGISAVAKITVKDNKKTADKPYSNHKNSKTKENKKQHLPKTGEKTRRIDTFIGSGLILVTVLFLVKKKKILLFNSKKA